MIGAREIAKMKQGTYLINNARGTIVDVDASAGAQERIGEEVIRKMTEYSDVGSTTTQHDQTDGAVGRTRCRGGMFPRPLG